MPYRVKLAGAGTIAGALGLALVAIATRTNKSERAAVGEAPADSAVVAIGKQIFFDASLSASKRLACSSCHDPTHAYGPSNARAVQLGGARLDAEGMRAVPSLRYVLNRTPTFYKEYASSLADRIREGNEPPTGGFGADGRFTSLHEQAAFPLLAPNEMANAEPGAIVASLSRAKYANEFRNVFGDGVFDDSVKAFANALYAIERFELEDASFHPYDSKYDAYLDGRAALTPAERRGLALFDDSLRGNCASCHRDQKGADGSHPLFTDYQFGALGVPRNTEIQANKDSMYFDLGLCGPARADLANRTDYCGMFKTPSLRNVAARRSFFHNGRFHSLRDALRFYSSRDTDPKQWYSAGSVGRAVKFDDLPMVLRQNVDTIAAPLNRRRGGRALWNEAEIDDVIAFLNTLTDGYMRK